MKATVAVALVPGAALKVTEHWVLEIALIANTAIVLVAFPACLVATTAVGMKDSAFVPSIQLMKNTVEELSPTRLAVPM